jgi:hypothetical protein
MASKNHFQVWTKKLRMAKCIIPFARSTCLLPDDSADRIAIELWFTNHEFCPADIIPPRFSMLIYHLGDEE